MILNAVGSASDPVYVVEILASLPFLVLSRRRANVSEPIGPRDQIDGDPLTLCLRPRHLFGESSQLLSQGVITVSRQTPAIR